MVRRCISRRRNDALVILETARTFGHSELPGNPRFRKEDVAPREMLVDEQALVSVPCEAHEDHQVGVPELRQQLHLLLEPRLLRLRQHLERKGALLAVAPGEAHEDDEVLGGYKNA